jgi:membrane-associated protease RseP (regulator of RpoE activity)
MKHSLIATAFAAALVLPSSAPVFAADSSVATTQAQSPSPSPSQAQAQAMRGYLGVTINRLPDPVRAQLPDTIPREQGLLVEQVMKGSPAEKAGLQPFDILLQYNDQKLFSPEQLTRLVGSDTGKQPVKLTIVRGGKVSTLDVTIGETRLPESAQRSGPELHPLHRYHPRQYGGPGPQASESNEKVWESFDSLSLDKLNGDKYKAVIGYLAKDGTHKRLEFQGTRDEIRQQIQVQKDLPATERDQLLDALTARDDDAFPFANWGFAPLDQEFLTMPPPWWGWSPNF